MATEMTMQDAIYLMVRFLRGNPPCTIHYTQTEEFREALAKVLDYAHNWEALVWAQTLPMYPCKDCPLVKWECGHICVADLSWLPHIIASRAEMLAEENK